MYAWNAPNICIIHSSCGPAVRKESWPTCMKEVKRWSFFCRDLMSSRAKGWLLQKVPTACLIFSSSPPLNYKTASQRICGWVVESLITQRRPTTMATGYKQNMMSYPRQQLISYVVDDWRLVLLAYRCHLIRYPHWNLKKQMPWWDMCGDLSEENVFWKKTYYAIGWFPPGWWICSWCQQGAVCFLGWVSGRRHCLGPSTCVHGLAPCRTVLRASEGYLKCLNTTTTTVPKHHL